MKFKRIKIKNIRSYIDQEIEFPEGSLLLSGEIGSGKTSILLALEYALFGLQPGQKGGSLLRNNSDLGEVTLEIELGDKLVSINRKLKRSSKGISNEHSSITIDGERIDSSVTEIKSKIVNLLGYPPEFIKKNNVLYRYTVFTPQEQMKQIILEDSEKRLNILRHIFGIDKYRQIKDNLAIIVANLKSELKMIGSEIKTLDEDKSKIALRFQRISEIHEEIKIKETALESDIIRKKNIEAELKDIDQRIEEKRNFSNELEKTKILISTKKELLSSIRKEKLEISRLMLSVPEIDDKSYSELIASIKNARILLENLNISSISIKGKINSLENERADLLSRKERVFRIDVCPTCLQNVSENHKHNIFNEVERKISEMKQSSQSIYLEAGKIEEETRLNKNLLAQLEDRKLELEIFRSKKEILLKSRERLLSLEREESNIERDLRLLLAHTDHLKESMLKYTVFDNHHRIKTSELESLREDVKRKEISLAELKKELEFHHNEIDHLQKSIERKESAKKEMENLAEVLDWLSNQFLKLVEFTERNVLLKLRNDFSSLFRKWFLMLIPENSLDVRIDENFTPLVIQKETEMDYDFLSGGERTAVALAYRLALNQTINSIFSKIKTKGIIILDEPTDGFSEDQIIKIRDILEELNADQLIIVSHEQKIEGFVDNLLKITKEGDVSVVRNQEESVNGL